MNPILSELQKDMNMVAMKIKKKKPKESKPEVVESYTPKLKRGSRHDPPTNPLPKGHNLSRGRKKGSKNKFTTLKQAFFDVFNELGGVQELKRWAKEDPANQKVFYQMISRMLPREVALSTTKEDDIQKIKVEIVGGNP